MLYSFAQFEGVLDSLDETLDTVTEMGETLIDLVEEAYENQEIDEDTWDSTTENLEFMLDDLDELSLGFQDLLEDLGDTSTLEALNAALSQQVVFNQLNEVIDGFKLFGENIAALQANPVIGEYVPLQEAIAQYDTILSGLTFSTFLAGTREDDILEGEDGDDALNGFNGDDDLFGDEGDDVLCGMNGEDYLEGDAGDDVLTGLDDNDVLLGDDGEDVLVGGEGNDKVTGGNDSDIFVCGDGPGRVIIRDFENRVDFLSIDFTVKFGALDIEGRRGDVLIKFEGDLLAKVNDTGVKAVTSEDFVTVA